MRLVVNLLLLTASLALAACGGGGGGSGGGGGGGGGGNNNPPPTFSADKTAVAFVLNEGASALPQFVTITVSGTFSGVLYVGAVIEGDGIDPAIQASINGNQAVFTFSPRAGLAPGTYTGQVLLLACSDQDCRQQISNSPLAVAYSVEIRAVLRVTPSQITLSAVSGAGASQTVSVQLPFNASTSTVTLPPGVSWLGLANVSDTGFTLNASSLPSGSYFSNVQVIAGNSSTTVPITYVVTGPPGGDRFLSASPSNLTLATVESAQSPAATLIVTPPSWNPLVTPSVSYPAGAPGGWLEPTATAAGFDVRANALNLGSGSYTATLTLNGTYPSLPVTIPVALTVGIGLVRPADVLVTLDAESTTSDLSGTVPINVVAGPGTNWTASSSAAWLVLTDASGATGESLAYTLDAAAVSALANATTHSASIVITPQRATMSPVSFVVTLEKRLPQITSIGPYVHLVGGPLRIILRGSGFDGIATPLTRFSVEGGSITSADRINDTEVVVRTSALSVGSHEIDVSNALEMLVSNPAVTVVAPQSFGAASVPTGGVLRFLTFDAERGAVYGANITLERVMRFRPSGAGWTADWVPYTLAYDVGLSNDGTKLIASSSDYSTHTASIRLLDPVTLATLSTTDDVPGNLQPTFTYHGLGHHTTNDGRTWLGVGGGLDGLYFFRADTLAVTPFRRASSYIGPWFTASRDGERLIIVQNTGLSPPPPMLYMDAADSVLRVNPAGLTAPVRIDVNEDGSRALFDGHEVRDADFNLIGRIALPTAPPGQPVYDFRAARLTVDGNRAYVLAYRTDFHVPGVNPRVFVYDTSTAQATEELPALGYFDLSEYPSCRPAFPGDRNCDGLIPVVAAISLDANTLFFAGNERLLVVPIPGTLSPVSLGNIVGTGKTMQWRLDATP